MAKMNKALPVAGYTPQSNDKVALVNANKELEERCLRAFDDLFDHGDIDGQMLAIAVTNLQQAFMWANRAVFQPQRIKLPEDNQ